ncbi:dioxygenase family protein [Nocardioides nitrophenolicus]|uniref:dioxygenase family protein n=1 Tax=Nocardioides nitrophenolicus TaxID=60489 RepID=UPI001957676C|nr:dioxygenase [Nocardioides nitrophenolicus]MBM7518626.1 protocatechuate 3,4-dioxygenase beta subunit [Nocardioides nitrophenolicus]
MSNDRSERLTERVLESLAPSDPRLHELITAAIRHLHSFVREVGLTHHEWEVGIEFLTAAGKISTSERQEMILLSDVLGVSSQTELTSGDASATANTVLGPFYVEGSKWREYGDSIVESPDAGARLRVDGVVRRPDGTPVADAVVDVWQNATNALYAVQDVEQDPQNLRGRFRTDDAGRFSFITVRPVAYAIPDDGPVGSLLEHLGRHPMRPAHIHIKVSAPDYQTLVTHLFDSESPYLDSDTVFSVDESLVITVKPTEQDDPPLQVQFDLVLAPSAS